jgi:hypothetical protein
LTSNLRYDRRMTGRLSLASLLGGEGFLPLSPRCPPIHFACSLCPTLAAPPVGLMGGHRLVRAGSKGRLNWDQKIPLLDGNSLDRYILHGAENGYRKVRMLGFGERRGLPVRTANLLSNPAKAFAAWAISKSGSCGGYQHAPTCCGCCWARTAALAH